IAAARLSVTRAQIPVDQVTVLNLDEYIKYDHGSTQTPQNKRELLLVIHDDLELSLGVQYWPGGFNVPAFVWESRLGPERLYGKRAFIPLILILLGGLVRFSGIGIYRSRRAAEYCEYEKAQTKLLFEARRRLDGARQLWQRGDSAKALVEIAAI